MEKEKKSTAKESAVATKAKKTTKKSKETETLNDKAIKAEEVEAGANEESSDASDETKVTEIEQERPEVEGILDIAEAGFGFLRFNNFLTSEKDIYVSQTQIRRFGLRTGDKIRCISRHPNQGERFGALLYVKEVNGESPISARRRPHFDRLTPIFPNETILSTIGGNEEL